MHSELYPLTKQMKNAQRTLYPLPKHVKMYSVHFTHCQTRYRMHRTLPIAKANEEVKDLKDVHSVPIVEEKDE